MDSTINPWLIALIDRKTQPGLLKLLGKAQIYCKVDFEAHVFTILIPGRTSSSHWFGLVLNSAVVPQ